MTETSTTTVIELTQAQTSFAIMVAGGCGVADAWVRANLGVYSKVKADRLLDYPEVKAILAEIRAKAEEDAVMNLIERRKFLADVVRTPADKIGPDSPLCQGFKETVVGTEVKIPDKLKAIDMDSRLAGDLDKTKDDDVSALSGLIAALRNGNPAS